MKVKAGIIGLGVGEQLLRLLDDREDVDVLAICDSNPKKLLEVSSKFPKVKSYQNDFEIIENPEINLVCIATYDDAHCSQILASIDKDKHVFVEKPVCLFKDEARAIIDHLKEKPNLKLSSNLILRKSQRFLDLKSRIESGQFGEIFALDADYYYGRVEKLTKGWRGEIDYYSVFLGGGIHMLDLIRWLSGVEVESVYAVSNKIVTKGTNYRFDDYISSLISFENGIQGRVSANFGCVHPHHHSLKVFGSKSTFVNEFELGKIYSSRDPLAPVEMVTSDYPGCKKGDLLDSFVNEIINDSPPVYSTKDVFESMAVGFAVEESLRTSQPVTLSGIRSDLNLT